MKQADIVNKKECICAMEMLATSTGNMHSVNTIRMQANETIPMLAADVLNMADVSMEQVPRQMDLIRNKYQTNFTPFLYYAEFLMISQIFSNRIKAGWDKDLASNEAMIYLQKMAEQIGSNSKKPNLFERLMGDIGKIPVKYTPETISGFYECLDTLAERVKQPEAQPA